MRYLDWFTPHHIALLSDWLAETGELYVDIYLPHSGYGGTPYFVRSMLDVKTLVGQQTHPELCVTVFRHTPYPLRGIANDELLEEALKQIPDAQWYSMVSLDHYFPSPCVILGCGDSHQEFRTEFSEIIGEHVGIGQNPFDFDHKWMFTRPDEVFILQVLRVLGVQGIHSASATMTTNWKHYEPYATDPEKYKWVETLWQNPS